MTQLGQTSHSRLLGLKITDQNIALTSRLFDIFNKVQTEGITLTNENVFIYFDWSWSWININLVGVEVESVMQVQDPFLIKDFNPEYYYIKTLKLEDGLMETPELLKSVNEFNNELSSQNLKIGPMGRLSFKWGQWSDELRLELFSISSEE
jgi:hypothetical protein